MPDKLVPLSEINLEETRRIDIERKPRSLFSFFNSEASRTQITLIQKNLEAFQITYEDLPTLMAYFIKAKGFVSHQYHELGKDVKSYINLKGISQIMHTAASEKRDSDVKFYLPDDEASYGAATWQDIEYGELLAEIETAASELGIKIQETKKAFENSTIFKLG